MPEPSDATRIVSEPDPHDAVNVAQGYRIDNRLYLSGQTAVDSTGSIVGHDDFLKQAQQVFTNLKRALAKGGSSLDQVFKVTIYVTDMDYFGHVIKARETYFSKPYPADTIVEVNSLAIDGAMLEVEAVALVGGEVKNPD